MPEGPVRVPSAKSHCSSHVPYRAALARWFSPSSLLVLPRADRRVRRRHGPTFRLWGRCYAGVSSASCEDEEQRLRMGTVTVDAVRALLREGRWAWSAHAQQAAGGWQVSAEDLTEILDGAELLEQYPSTGRGPSALLLGHTRGGRALHAVVGYSRTGNLVIVTVYEPTMPKWRDPRTRNR